MISAGAHLMVLLQLLPVPAIGVIGVQTNRHASEGKTLGKAKVHHKVALGVMNRVGVTKYQRHAFRSAKRTDGKFFWPDSANRDGQLYAGATDLTDNVSWGWHHPSGIYNTIPVGSPLLDDQLNISLGADDAIRKFAITGEIIWSYAPRGQLAAAPTLVLASSRRQAARVQSDMNAEEEELLRPDWAKGNTSDTDPAFRFFKDFRVGDAVKVKPGLSYRADGKEL